MSFDRASGRSATVAARLAPEHRNVERPAQVTEFEPRSAAFAVPAAGFVANTHGRSTLRYNGAFSVLM
ncbi:MAG: hypothetical protein M3Z15_13730, partial [Pseudomonadota bacterium]|nr:hypothetical protein [Pseudomonadota bacterium]